MKLQERIQLAEQLGDYMKGNSPEWLEVQDRASRENSWFIPEFIALSIKNITDRFLNREALESFAKKYSIPDENLSPKKVGLVLAGNIPLVGFHDVLCTFLAGHIAVIKPSSKDNILLKHLVEKMQQWDARANEYFILQDMLKNCDAYIATGSNNTSRYFEHYFQKYPHIIRRNRSSAAILTGEETAEELEKLSDDICQYFGLGCRNVTKLLVPKNYDFEPLIKALGKYAYLANHNKLKNNYDYQLAAHLLNNRYYMTNGHLLLIENDSLFAPISQVNYQYYETPADAERQLAAEPAIQCVTGKGHTPFGAAQCPPIDTFADGVDTMKFLLAL